MTVPSRKASYLLFFPMYKYDRGGYRDKDHVDYKIAAYFQIRILYTLS